MHMRHYESIWTKLKSLPPKEAATTGISVTANRLLHARILKAVIKEKYNDFGFRILLDDRKATLTHTRKHSVLTFYLTYTLGKEDF